MRKIHEFTPGHKAYFFVSRKGDIKKSCSCVMRTSDIFSCKHFAKCCHRITVFILRFRKHKIFNIFQGAFTIIITDEIKVYTYLPAQYVVDT